MNEHLNERLLQRCVDGEMSETEQQEFLRSLDRTPSGWRDLALAYVEQQLWTQAGRAWIDEPEPVPALDSVTPPGRAASWLRSTVLVASSLLAVGLGYLGGTYWRPGSMSSSDLAVTTSPEPGLLAVGPTAQISPVSPSGTPVVQVAVPGQSGQAVALPVYDVEDLVPAWSDPAFTSDQQNLRDRGIRLDSRPKYYTVPVDDRRKLVLPVHMGHQRFQ
jgi:hypothetical protein